MRLEHIGIALQDDKAIRLFERLLNATPYKAETVSHEGVTTTFFGDAGESGEAPKVELLQALSDESPVQRFINKRGPGLHHLAFQVDDIRTEMERLKNEGFQLLSNTPTPGADGKEIVFLHPKTTGGVLVELCQALQTEPEIVKVPFQGTEVAAHLSGDESAPPLVVLHGMFGNVSHKMNPFIRRWEHSFHVIGIDLPGHGKSGVLQEAAEGWDTYASSLITVLDGLSIERPAVFGYSMGGSVALAAAAEHPERLGPLVVHATTSRWTEEEVTQTVDVLDLTRLEQEEGPWLKQLAKMHGENQWRSLIEEMRAFVRGLHRPEHAISDVALQRIQQPVLVSHGDRDRAFELQHPLHLYETLPDARLWILPDVGHAIQDVDPTTFVESTGRFLSG